MRCCGVADRGHSRAAQLVAGARLCLGRRFRPLGRGPDAYDCVGVVVAAAQAARIPIAVPYRYDLRWVEAERVWEVLCGAGFVPVQGSHCGDLLWASTGGRQHFRLWTGASFIEADAGLRRVVERPADSPEGSAWRFPEGD